LCALIRGSVIFFIGKTDRPITPSPNLAPARPDSYRGYRVGKIAGIDDQYYFSRVLNKNPEAIHPDTGRNILNNRFLFFPPNKLISCKLANLTQNM